MRLLEILFYLLKSSSKTTIKQLSEMFNVSQKTIQRDLDKLSVLGIPVISYRGINGGVEIDKNYIIAKYILKESDYENLILSLYISQNILECIKNADLIDKFKFVDNDRCTKILEELDEKFIIDLKDKGTEHSNVYKAINESLDKKYYIKIEVDRKTLEIFPICYVLKNEGLYLYYYDEGYKIILMDKISNSFVIEKKYNGSIIKYNDNKDNIKLDFN